MPISTNNLCRYAAYLARTRCYNTVHEYLNTVRILHLEQGCSNPLASNFQLTSVLQGIKRQKGHKPNYKLPICTDHLAKLREQLDLCNVYDAQFWCALLVCFYGLLRISAVCLTSIQADRSNVLCRKDICFSAQGCTLQLRHSKTNQFQERAHTVVLPHIKGNRLCPTSALIHFISIAGKVPQDEPLLTFMRQGSAVHLLQDIVRRRLASLLASIGLSASDYGTHSLRRGGATWLLNSGVSVEEIKSVGDWRSDCVSKYLKPSVSDRFKTLNNITKNINTT